MNKKASLRSVLGGPAALPPFRQQQGCHHAWGQGTGDRLPLMATLGVSQGLQPKGEAGGRQKMSC